MKKTQKKRELKQFKCKSCGKSYYDYESASKFRDGVCLDCASKER